MEETQESLKQNWQECIFCLRKWKVDSLELELCPDCFHALRCNGYRGYDTVKLEMLLKYGEFKDPLVQQVLNLMWEELQKRAMATDDF